MSETDIETLRDRIVALVKRRDVSLSQILKATGGRFAIMEIEEELVKIADALVDNGDRVAVFRKRYAPQFCEGWPAGISADELAIWMRTEWRFGGGTGFDEKPPSLKGGRKKARPG